MKGIKFMVRNKLYYQNRINLLMSRGTPNSNIIRKLGKIGKNLTAIHSCKRQYRANLVSNIAKQCNA